MGEMLTANPDATWEEYSTHFAVLTQENHGVCLQLSLCPSFLCCFSARGSRAWLRKGYAFLIDFTLALTNIIDSEQQHEVLSKVLQVNQSSYVHMHNGPFHPLHYIMAPLHYDPL